MKIQEKTKSLEGIYISPLRFIMTDFYTICLKSYWLYMHEDIIKMQRKLEIRRKKEARKIAGSKSPNPTHLLVEICRSPRKHPYPWSGRRRLSAGFWREFSRGPRWSARPSRIWSRFRSWASASRCRSPAPLPDRIWTETRGTHPPHFRQNPSE